MIQLLNALLSVVIVVVLAGALVVMWRRGWTEMSQINEPQAARGKESQETNDNQA